MITTLSLFLSQNVSILSFQQHQIVLLCKPFETYFSIALVSFPLNLWSVFSTCQWLNWLQSCAVWNFNLIILFGSNQRCLGESDVLILRVGWVFSWRFCSEGRKHSIVNGQSFRLPIETTRTENLSEMFHTILGYSSWAAKRRRLKNFCVTIGWAKYPHKVENLTTQKDTPFWQQKHKNIKNTTTSRQIYLKNG